MEQKQLDEMEDSYFGEEFIDEDELVLEEAPIVEEISEIKEEPKIEIVEEVAVKPAKEKKPAKKKTAKKTTSKKTEDKLEVKSASEKSDLKDSVEAAKPVDPWADEDEDDSGAFKEASTWKAIAGIAIVLLIVSLFTQGFHFSDGAATDSSEVAAGLSITEAEGKALGFVNENLLQPPFLAELESSEDVGQLYKVTLGVAGQSLDSYITKDGELFFPQGFSVDNFEPVAENNEVVAAPVDVPVEPVAEAPAEEPVAEVLEELVVEEPAAEENTEEEAPVEEVVEPVVVPEPVVEEPVAETVEVNLRARKWLFEPFTVKVKQGSLVKLNVLPQDLQFTFAVPEFGVEEEISGATAFEFTADKVGNFEFLCSSCDAIRGMTGTLVVE